MPGVDAVEVERRVMAFANSTHGGYGLPLARFNEGQRLPKEKNGSLGSPLWRSFGKSRKRVTFNVLIL